MEIRPFRGWRYQVGADRDVSAYIAPPYDILGAEDKAELLARDERNIVAVDLPHVPPKELGPEEAYTAAAALLERWKADGVVRQDDRPALYVYEQEYTWGGTRYARRAMICGVRGTELGEDVVPHEHVFPGPLADRLRLTQRTRMQLSPIFGFYEDPEGRVAELLSEAAAGEPAMHGELRGVTERLWLLTDAARIGAIASILYDVPTFIADGHHRYTTSRNYRKTLGGESGLPPDHEANFVMFALVARDDAGLLILPTHRVFSGLRQGASVAELAGGSPEFSWRRCEVAAEPQAIDDLLKSAGSRAMVFLAGRDLEVWLVELKDLEPMRQAAPEESDEWRALPPAVLHKLIMDKALRPLTTEQLSVEYTPEIARVLDACRTGRAQLGACLPSIPVASVEAIARSGASMPHKSTYFYPKLATGMVLKPLE